MSCQHSKHLIWATSIYLSAAWPFRKYYENIAEEHTRSNSNINSWIIPLPHPRYIHHWSSHIRIRLVVQPTLGLFLILGTNWNLKLSWWQRRNQVMPKKLQQIQIIVEFSLVVFFWCIDFILHCTAASHSRHWYRYVTCTCNTSNAIETDACMYNKKKTNMWKNTAFMCKPNFKILTKSVKHRTILMIFLN